MKIDKPILLECNYFPSVEYIALFLISPEIIIESQENYQKGSFRNRTTILTANGRHDLSIPLNKGKHQQTPIREVGIAPIGNWNIIHFRTIQSAYGKSPFFDHYRDEIENILTSPTDSLWEVNLMTIRFLLKAFRIDTPISYNNIYTSTFPEGNDFRNSHKILLENSSFVQSYEQVFSHKMPFEPHLSALDLLFCHGPYGKRYIEHCGEKIKQTLLLD